MGTRGAGDLFTARPSRTHLNCRKDPVVNARLLQKRGDFSVLEQSGNEGSREPAAGPRSGSSVLCTSPGVTSRFRRFGGRKCEGCGLTFSGTGHFGFKGLSAPKRLQRKKEDEEKWKREIPHLCEA